MDQVVVHIFDEVTLFLYNPQSYPALPSGYMQDAYGTQIIPNIPNQMSSQVVQFML